MLSTSVPQNLISKQLQMQAQGFLDQARFYKATQHFEMALASYDQAKVTFKHAENTHRKPPPLSKLKSAFSQAQILQTEEDKLLRQHIAEVYFERAEVLKSLGEYEKAQKSYEKAQTWGDECLPAIRSPASLPSVGSTIGLPWSVDFFPTKTSLTPSPKLVEDCLEEKHQWVAQVFETILKQFQDLDLCQSSPSLFLVYAHNNHRLGKANAEASRCLIEWLTNLRANLYSDRSANGHQVLPLRAAMEDKAKANDILSSQLCLLPNHSGTVDYVVLCGSELLGRYMASPYYLHFCEAVQRAYQEVTKHTNDFTQIEVEMRNVVKANLKEKEFHHVLTELAFLQIRYQHYQDKHGIIPVLLNSKAEQCLPQFIFDSTTIRIEDLIWCTPNLWDGRQTYQDEGLHIGFFKLLKRLFVRQTSCIAILENKIYQACLQRLREDDAHTLTAGDFSSFLTQSSLAALDTLKQEHSADLRELNVHRAHESLLAEIKRIHGEAIVSPEQIQSALTISYRAKSSVIQRLSGSDLPMEDCYINLAIVEYERIRKKEKQPKEGEEKEAKAEKVVLDHSHRLPGAEAMESIQQKLVPLEELFEPRELSKGKTVTPKRILISGRAGVGKTTLSKKIVYEYTRKGQWRDRFEYMLWIPLRTLKGRQSCDWVTLFYQTYFHTHPKGLVLARALKAQIEGPAREKTLFVLDGWDEVAQEWGENEPMAEFLKNLLNQPAVLITSRPFVGLKQAKAMDLELETLGFSPKDVINYLDNPAMISVSRADEMKRFIQANAPIQGLVNVPIQLEALCYSWDEIKRMQQETRGEMTTTGLYQAMINKLWRKDMLRLDKREGGKLLSDEAVRALRKASRIEQAVQAESNFLSALAFHGLQSGRIEFDTAYLDDLIEQLIREGKSLPLTLEVNLKKLSFLHTDDAEESQQSYHFMHLTFQEFFAAKHFAAHWEARREITLMSADTQRWVKVLPEAFVRQHKYNPRYEIFWWFVSGLLRGEGLMRFFALLEAEPLDLVGAYHQRLIMSCLYEASRAPDVGLPREIRDRLEEQLAQWLQWEIDKRRACTLAHHSTFPEQILLSCLENTTLPLTKQAVTTALGYRAALSEFAFNALVVQAKDESMTDNIVQALGQQSSRSESALKAVIGLTKDSDWKVRYTAAKALSELPSLTESVLQAMIDLKKDWSWSVRAAAAEGLGKLPLLPGSVLQALLTLAQDRNQDHNVRRATAEVLGKISPLPESVRQALFALVEDQGWNVKLTAAKALDKLFLQSQSALETLIELVEDKHKDVGFSAVEALGKLPSLSESALQPLLTLAQNQDQNIKRAAVEAVDELRSLPHPALHALLKRAKEDKEAEWSVRLAAVKALDKRFSRSQSSLLALIESLADKRSWDVRCAAAEALGKQTALPEPALEALLKLAQNRSGGWGQIDRCAAVKALGNQSSLSESALQILVVLAKDKDQALRFTAAMALGEQHTRSGSESAWSALLTLTADPDKLVRLTAFQALGALSLLPESELLTVRTLTQDPDKLVRLTAFQVLGKLSSLSESDLLAWLTLAKEQRRTVKCNAVEALGELPSLPDSVLRILLKLAQEDDDLKYIAVNVLDRHRWALYRLLPTLNGQQIEMIYTKFLRSQRFAESMPCYIQGGMLCFYTAEGLQTVPLGEERDEFKEAIQQVQKAADIPSPFHLAVQDQVAPTEE